MMRSFASLLFLIALPLVFLHAEEKPTETDLLDGRDGRPLALDQFRPKSQLKAKRSEASRAKFPVIDVHVHPRIRFRHAPQLLDEFIKVMDEHNVALCVSLDGQLGENLTEHLQYLKPYEERFLVFSNIAWIGSGKREEPSTWDCHRPEFGRRMVRELKEAKKRGVCGLKVFKQLGLGYRNPDGSLVEIDDPRWDPIWSVCGELGLPVIIHTADPIAFFEPIDETNERWEELSRHPDWSFHGLDPTGRPWPSRESLLEARNRVIKRHPNTKFIGAHMANSPEDLTQVSKWLDQYPNLVVEISSRIAELGRQPYTTREFFLKYQDRIMFGTDGPRVAGRLLPHWRFFQTKDEYFAYAENPFPPQGLWRIHGINLPEEALKKLYYENAMNVIPGAAEKLRHLQQSNRGMVTP